MFNKFCFLLNSLFFCMLFYACNGPVEEKSESRPLVSEPGEEPVVQNELPLILFFGNSITAGYQLDIEDAFPNLIQQRLDTLGYKYEVVNGGLSGETTAAGVDRIDWVLRSVPDIFFLELGANDGLRGLPLSETKRNLQLIMDKVRAVNPNVKIILAGMQVPPNLGKEYTEEFSTLFTELANSEDITLIPFILDGVAGIPELNLSDGIHPTPEGHQIVAETVWKYLKPLIKSENL